MDSFDVPILFLTFNRLDTTIQVFEKIRFVKPTKLYLASDGPRVNKTGENEIVDDIRKWIIKNIDWQCEIKTLFRNENLGCKIAVSNAIDWFFKSEEFGIILEDDVVPNKSFFWFCREMLIKYQNDERIMMIGGTNYFLETSQNNEDYFFSKQYAIWGWATWKRAWSLYDVDIKTWRREIKPEQLDYFTPLKSVVKYWTYNFDLIQNKKIDTWDIQWVYTCLTNYGLTIIPHKNLITNIGLDGAHADGSITDSHFLKTFEFSKHESFTSPEGIFPSSNYDLSLHLKKTVPAYRNIFLIELIKSVGIYEKLRSIKRLLKKQR